MGRRVIGVVVVAALAVVVLFMARPTGRNEFSEDPAPPSGTETSSVAVALTGAEREWCEEHAGRVAGVAYLDYREEGAPALFESERLSGSLRPETLEAFLVWQDLRPDLYEVACGATFATWAGNE